MNFVVPQMTVPPVGGGTSAEERAIVLYQEIMRVSREKAEHAYMLFEASFSFAQEHGVHFSAPA